jgi:hypothetical protein
MSPATHDERFHLVADASPSAMVMADSAGQTAPDHGTATKQGLGRVNVEGLSVQHRSTISVISDAGVTTEIRIPPPVQP